MKRLMGRNVLLQFSSLTNALLCKSEPQPHLKHLSSIIIFFPQGLEQTLTMAPFGTLYTVNGFVHAHATRILAAANLNGLEIHIPQDFQFGVTNQSPEYKAKFPHGKIPSLETSSGFCLAEGSAIALHVAQSGPCKDQLLGRTPEDRALVQMWVSLADSEIYPQSNAILGPIIGIQKYNAEVVEEKEKQFVRALQRLELHLAQEGKTWLVRDDELSLADLSVAGAVYWPLKFFLDSDHRREYPKIMEWWERLLSVDEVGKVFSAPVKLCEKRPAADGSEAPKVLK